MKTREQINASSKVREAVRKGKLKKPNKCSSCGRKILNPKLLHAHHPNGYDNPFDIQWLCHWCHEIVHAGGEIPPPPNMGWCCNCKAFLPKEKFNKDKSAHNGLREYCKYHQSKRKKKYLDKQRLWNTYIRLAANSMGS